MLGRQQPVDGLDVFGARRLGLANLAAGKTHAKLVAHGFGSTAAKSNTQASCVTAFRIVSRLEPDACSSATASAISCGREGVERTRGVKRPVIVLSDVPMFTCVFSAISIRDARYAATASASVGACAGSRLIADKSGTRIAASSPSNRRRRSSASARVRKLPA